MKKKRKLWQQQLGPAARLRKAFSEEGFIPFTLLRRFCKKGGLEGFIAVKDPARVTQPEYSQPGTPARLRLRDGQASAVIARERKDGKWQLQALDSIPHVRSAARGKLSPKLAASAQVNLEVLKQPFNHQDRRGHWRYLWPYMVQLKELEELATLHRASFDKSERQRIDSRIPQQPPVSP